MVSGKKTEIWIDCRKNIFGSEVNDIILDDENIIFKGTNFKICEKISLLTNRLNLPEEKILGVEIIEKNKETNNWFEKLLRKKEEWIRIYY